MSRHRENNPHFVRPSQLPGADRDHHRTLTGPWGPQPRDDDRHPHQSGHRHSRHHHRRDKHDRSPRSHHHPAPVPVAAPLPLHHDDQPHQPLYPHNRETYQPPHNDHHHQPHGEPVLPHLHHHEDHPKPHDSTVSQPHHPVQQRPVQPFARHHEDRFPRRRGPQDADFQMPSTRPTNPLTWFGAAFCAIFWVVIILGGLAVLIVYLIFRPKSPRFDVSAATLNAAYLDMGYLLNADLTVLANFTNPNKKVRVDFSSMYIELYYGRTLIATQYIDPFSAPKAETKFENLHMVTSQVRLSELEIQRFKRQMMGNGVLFDVKGFFRARSNFGGLLRYSYWLHGRCTIMVTRPPDGVLVAKKCKSKH